MDSQERFFEENIEKIREETKMKVMQYEKLLQEERAKAKFADSNSGYCGESQLR